MIDNNDARYAYKWLKNDYMDMNKDINWLNKKFKYNQLYFLFFLFIYSCW